MWHIFYTNIYLFFAYLGPDQPSKCFFEKGALTIIFLMKKISQRFITNIFLKEPADANWEYQNYNLYMTSQLIP